MAPQCKEKSLKVDITQAALPFSGPVYERSEAQKQIDGGGSQSRTPSNSQVETNTSSLENSSLRITTRARYTYELDRYRKNAMLIIDNRSCRGNFETEHYLDEAFQKFRFEIEKHFHLNECETSDVCKKFFERDFTEYGAVAIALMTTSERYFHRNLVIREHIVTSNFTENLPASLKGKPIIYISEIPDFYINRRESMRYPDILNFHITNSVVSYTGPEPKLLPLETLSRSLKEVGDEKPLMDIMNSTISDIVRTWPFYQDHPISISSTLTKELVLVKS